MTLLTHTLAFLAGAIALALVACAAAVLGLALLAKPADPPFIPEMFR